MLSFSLSFPLLTPSFYYHHVILSSCHNTSSPFSSLPTPSRGLCSLSLLLRFSSHLPLIIIARCCSLFLPFMWFSVYPPLLLFISTHPLLFFLVVCFSPEVHISSSHYLSLFPPSPPPSSYPSFLVFLVCRCPSHAIHVPFSHFSSFPFPFLSSFILSLSLFSSYSRISYYTLCNFLSFPSPLLSFSHFPLLHFSLFPLASVFFLFIILTNLPRISLSLLLIALPSIVSHVILSFIYLVMAPLFPLSLTVPFFIFPFNPSFFISFGCNLALYGRLFTFFHVMRISKSVLFIYCPQAQVRFKLGNLFFKKSRKYLCAGV